MKKMFFLVMALSCFTISNVQSETSLLGNSKEQQIIVNNRILAIANGKAISVIDLMKKMDMLFFRQYPQFNSSAQARYQFYLANWKFVLSEMIDKELIKADAEESKLTINAGDVRQEMESVFGPNIIENLDKIGLTFQEAYQMVLDDITIRRMMYFRVHSKAISQATPQKIREYYDSIAQTTIRDNKWIYRFITIRDKDSTKAAETANLAKALLEENEVAFSEIAEKIKEKAPQFSKNAKVTVSEEFQINEKELSDAFKKVLVTLTPNTYSTPTIQKSRSESGSVIRIFYLKEIIPGGITPFKELEVKIKEKLVEDVIEKESKTYLTKLRHYFDTEDKVIEELTTSEYQPFVLR